MSEINTAEQVVVSAHTKVTPLKCKLLLATAVPQPPCQLKVTSAGWKQLATDWLGQNKITLPAYKKSVNTNTSGRMNEVKQNLRLSSWFAPSICFVWSNVSCHQDQSAPNQNRSTWGNAVTIKTLSEGFPPICCISFISNGVTPNNVGLKHILMLACLNNGIK